ncbi:hypothetical protein K443DRAFT_108881 [Laccaria amethystina LaAM-08-1]|uniref:Copper transporter n=1 Tax=Laccaria amethystina LaAM-08-1 TaxID=1095629 RepID=A0A0C9WJV6_9AGAR|nr:hypothetical protein K443DRAFT_108881 [Laccaria amethystina LaAM-08-1]
MLLRLPTPACITTICFMILTWSCWSVVADGDLSHAPILPTSKDNNTQQQLLCLPFGACEPCPEESLQQPFCQPFGNRRLMHCVNITSPSNPPSPPSEHSPSQPHPEGETLAWESCGRIISQERADFFEFIACNVFFAIVALFVLFVRSRRLQAIQARQLAARIGLIRGNNGRR